MTYQANLQEIARQVESAVQMETYIWVDVLPQDPNWQIAAEVQTVLRTCLREAIESLGFLDMTTARESVRKAMLTQINRTSRLLMETALEGFCILRAAPVEYFINVSNNHHKPAWEPFDFDQFPGIAGHQEMLEAALRVRKFPASVQIKALRMAHGMSELQALEESEGMSVMEGLALRKEDALKREELLQDQANFKQTLPPTAIADMHDFYGYIAPGSFHPYALPIEIPEAATSEELRYLGGIYRYFGDDLCISFGLRMKGKAYWLKKTKAAREMYEGAGIGFKVLAAWVMAVDLIDSRRQCTICYRYISAIKRCAEHATKTQETREARLGKKVKPIYEKNLLTCFQMPQIKSLVRSPLSWTQAEEGKLLEMAKIAGLSALHTGKATVLASQLMQLSPVWNDEIAERVKRLLADILHTVRWIECLPRPVGDHEARVRERQKECARELLSLKGFFRAWCGKGDYSMDVALKMLGYDRDHPVVHGSALDSQGVSSSLLAQRVWEESQYWFMTSTSPTAKQIQALLKKGASKKQVAQELQISLATVYKILKRGVKPRRRNFFGHRNTCP